MSEELIKSVRLWNDHEDCAAIRKSWDEPFDISLCDCGYREIEELADLCERQEEIIEHKETMNMDYAEALSEVKDDGGWSSLDIATQKMVDKALGYEEEHT